jgi:hypothetical protein
VNLAGKGESRLGNNGSILRWADPPPSGNSCDIAERSEIPFASLRQSALKLVEAGLLARLAKDMA